MGGERYETPTSSEAVRSTVRGVRRRIGTKADRKAPATADLVKRMIRKMPDSLLQADFAISRPRERM